MNNTKRILSAIILIITLVGYYMNEQEEKNNQPVLDDTTVVTATSDFDFLPTSTTKQIVNHNYYSLSYSEKDEQPEWVAYTLRKKDIVYTDFKRPYFIDDPKVQTKSASWKNYKKSGYDKGHLCPAADRKFSRKAFNETFYTSNISPQEHQFNAGVWNRLEQKVRYWTKKYKQLYVVTGGVLTDSNLKTIGKERVTVPKYFYKVLLDYSKPEIKAIAFLIPHEESHKPLYKFVVSIDQLEKRTGIDFFPNLPDKLEKKLEASNNYKNWTF